MRTQFGNLASDVYPVGVIAAQAAGVTTFDSPVFDCTKFNAFSNVAVFLRIGTIVAGALLRPDFYTADDAAGTNPVKAWEGPTIALVDSEACTVQVTGVPHPFGFIRFNRTIQNSAITSGFAVMTGHNNGPVWSPHVTAPWF